MDSPWRLANSFSAARSRMVAVTRLATACPAKAIRQMADFAGSASRGRRRPGVAVPLPGTLACMIARRGPARFTVRLEVPRTGSLRAWGAMAADFERWLAEQLSPVVSEARVESETRRGRDSVAAQPDTAASCHSPPLRLRPLPKAWPGARSPT